MFGSFTTLPIAFGLLFFFKYVRLIGNLIGYGTYKPIHPGTAPRLIRSPGNKDFAPQSDLSDDQPTKSFQACREPSPEYNSEEPLTPQDVTVIVPALDPSQESLRRFLPTCVQNNPKEIFLVTIDEKLGQAVTLAESISTRITVLSIERPNKRRQILEALPGVSTKIIILADDDVVWPRNLLKWMLAPFDGDPKIGGVGTNQRVMKGPKSTFWDFLNSQYLIRRNFDCTACAQIDGGLPCLSGRTVAYRAKILQDPAFMWEFTHETWRTYLLNVDDDNFLTRWMVNHGWNTWIQNHPDCEVLTTLENNPLYISQCLRWSRTNWRSNLKSMFQERTIWKRYPWSSFAVFQTTLTSWSPIYDLALSTSFWNMTAGISFGWQCCLRSIMCLWIFWGCRAVKYVEHWKQYPEDLVYLPLLPFVGYLHTIIIKFWAMCTINRCCPHSEVWSCHQHQLKVTRTRSLCPARHSPIRTTRPFS
ncbi:hypothetical protein P152DRAFT_223581 [Eremomyces bilateralis CBS 781.70]|uniref:Polysaccharide synthase Cps1p n=1 Tax=Eremomyces bilateralis CBS 781.70 TaxID=1392243 RepID=A0A6G1FRE0_9PEZI|nr:uncharacterized protein P152DRAFT_223581 [Eremomyces bilateralis CBS 781.70]KAF1808347.1 hypothetical protein P152DRAFT_223581 [Eremomyces bilateralis CBS 781.70]